MENIKFIEIAQSELSRVWDNNLQKYKDRNIINNFTTLDDLKDNNMRFRELTEEQAQRAPILGHIICSVSPVNKTLSIINWLVDTSD